MPARRPVSHSRRPRGAAFTLVELLVVVAIMALCVAMTLPSLSGIGGAGNVNQAVDGISSLLEQARAYAMAHNTYVWVGFNDDLAAQRLTVGVVAGTTGQSDDLASSAYAPIAKLRVYNHFSLRNINNLPGMAANGDDIAASRIGPFRQAAGGAFVTFNDVLQYGPSGMANVLPNSSSHWIQIGLQPVRGSNASDPNIAAFQVATLTGQVQVFRR